MKTYFGRWLGVTALALSAALPGIATAQSTWNLGSSASCSAGSGNPNTATCSGSNAGGTATMTAWGTPGGSATTFVQGTLANWDPNGFGAYVGSDSGSPQHAFDNSNPAYSTELMLISFGSAKLLSSVAVGWKSGDTDVSILRWDGAAAPAVSGKTTAGLLSAGWSLVGSQDLDAGGFNFDNPNTAGSGLDAYKSTISLGNQVSSYWIISTYFGTASGDLDKNNDAFKILSFTTNVPGTPGQQSTVPEPSSLALAAIALVGVTATRRRRHPLERS